MASAVPPSYYTVAEAAELLGVQPFIVWRLLYAGKLPSFRERGGVGVQRDALDALRADREAGELSLKILIEMAHERAAVEPPTEEELARREAWAARVLANRERRDIRPLTSTDFVHMSREWMADPDAPTRW